MSYVVAKKPIKYAGTSLVESWLCQGKVASVHCEIHIVAGAEKKFSKKWPFVSVKPKLSPP